VSTSAAVRARAARIVAAVVQGRSLDTALVVDPAMSAQERGLLRTLAFDSVRWYLRLDAMLALLLSRPGQTMQPDIRALAIVGLCQLLYTEIPAHAAVNETVDAAKLLGHPRASGVINAVLRRCLRERDSLAARVDGDLAIRTAHPRWLVEQLAIDWPEQHRQILDANNERPPFWIRVNRRKISGRQYRRDLETRGWAILASLFDDEALLLERAVDVAELPGFSEGFVSVQDAAAQLAARLLEVQPGDRVLDACAAPGGKTGHILELQSEIGALLAIDVSAERLARVDDNLRRLGLEARTVQADIANAASWWDGEPFDRILLDVPCSATGVIRRHPDIKLLRRPEDIRALAVKQAELLRTCWSLLRPGGQLVYASCSALRAETTDVIGAFLGAFTDARDLTEESFRRLELRAGLGLGARIAAGSAGMDGFYYACLVKEAVSG
jgi:16S rRNA (cytosine967-C5)-methyltransferase